MTYEDFEKENNLRGGTKEHNCGYCVHGYTNGMLSPAYYCKKASECIGTSPTVMGYCYTSENCPGTICDLHEDERLILEPEIDWTEFNMSMLKMLASLHGIPLDEAKKRLEVQGFDLSKEMCSQAIAIEK